MSGDKEEIENDLEFTTTHDKGFKLYRTYHSRSEISTAMGFGWNHNYNIVLESFGSTITNAYKITDEAGRSHHYQDSDHDGTYIGVLSSQGTLVQGPDGAFSWQRANDVTYIFDQEQRFITKTDGNGNVQSLTYDAEGRLETVTDQATGRSIGFIYNAEGKIAHITGPITAAVADGIWVSYQYDVNGNLTRVVYADDGNGSAAAGFEYVYADPYDPHNLTEKRNLDGEFLSSWQYDNLDRSWKNTTRDGRGVTISSYGTSSVVVTDAQGVQKTYTIETINGRRTITHISGADGCASCGGDDAVRYGYDEYRRVNEIEYANGRIVRYADFDASDRYHTEIQAAGTPQERIFHYTYHPSTGDRLSISEVSILNGGNRETIFDYDDDGNDVPNENPTALMHRKIERGYTYDAAGALAPYEYVTTYTYTAKGQVEAIDGPLPGSQDLISYTYDSLTGDRLTETRPLVGTTTYGCDAAGNVTSITDPNGVVTTITYDGRNRQLATTRNGVTQSRTYTAAGEIDATTDALNRTMDYTYNAEGFVEKIVDPSGNFVYYGYDTNGRRTEESIFAADSTQTHYRGTDWGDPAANPDLAPGKPWKSLRRNASDTADLETVYTYDNSGNLASVTDANGNTTTYEYDLFGRLKNVIQPGNVITTYEYDLGGNLSSVIDAEGHATLYVYDDLNRLVETDSPDTGNTLYSYDEAGNLRFKTQNGNTIEYRYDALGRLTDILYSDPAQNVAMTYDTGSGNHLIGRLASVTDASGTVAYSYDAEGRLESETRTIGGTVFVTSYLYDAAGNLRALIYPTGHMVEYLPDTADPARIGSVMLDAGTTLASELAYKPFGPLAAMTLGNGLQVTQTYDKNYQIAAISGGTIMNRSYAPDNVGNIIAITDNLDPTRSQSFAYDDLYRLTAASGIYGSISYTNDNAGNRLSRTANAEQDAYTYYPGTNRLHVVTGTHAELIEYDADGNTTRRTPGAANPTPPITDPADYIYNSAGQRSQKQNSTPVLYHYDQSGQLIAETDPAGALIKAYVWLHGQPLAMIAPGGAIYYCHNDHLGTPQRLTDATGAVVWAADYLPFGKADVTVSAVENNLRFAGQYFDHETGLHYNWNRYYDPSLGRYLRADPSHSGQTNGLGIPFVIPSILDAPQELNSYSFVQNNPLNRTDSLGLFSYGTTDCRYYDRQCNRYGCDYYCNWASKWCRKFNRLNRLQWTHCVRKCLQDYDFQYCKPKNKDCPDCSDVSSCNWGGHFFCYTVCGAIHYDSGINNNG